MRRAWLLLAFVVACGPSKKAGHGGGSDGGVGSDAGPLPHTLTSVVVTPTNPIIELDLNSPGAQGFVATATYADGTSEDVSTQATWTVANPAVGTISSATLSIPAFSSATAIASKITASYQGMDGLAQITVVAYRKSGPQQDFFFILPYQDPGGPVMKPLDFSTAVPALDVFFMMDTTGSMSGEISNLQTGLTNTVIPGIQNAVTNAQFGVGSQADFPIDPFGTSGCDQPFVLKQAITATTSQVQAGVNSLSSGGYPISCGNDEPEAVLEAVYQAATGEGLSSPAPTNVPANHTGVGGVGFRTGTMPVIVSITDAPSHAKGEPGTCGTEALDYGAAIPTAHSRTDVHNALAAICARSVGIAAIGAGCSPLANLTDLATATGARVPPAAWDVGVRPTGCASNQCCTGQNGVGVAPDANGLCPLVFQVDTSGNGVGTQIVTGIQMLTRFATFDVTSSKMGGTTDTSGNPLPAPHTTADFIKSVTPTSFTLPPPPPNLPNPTFDTTTFHNVTPGTHVDFGVDAYNDFVQQTGDAQIFRATIQVLAGGCTPLDQRDVLILVPPTPVVVQ